MTTTLQRQPRGVRLRERPGCDPAAGTPATPDEEGAVGVAVAPGCEAAQPAGGNTGALPTDGVRAADGGVAAGPLPYGRGSDPRARMAQGQGEAATDLGALIRAYSAVAERLRESHELLQREVARLHEQLAEKDKLLERRERLAALGEMAAGVAHEIRNPLGGIELYVSLLERDLAEQPRPLEIVRRIGAGVRNLDHIVSDILAFARGSEPQLRPVRLGEVVQEALTQAAPLIRAHDIELVTEAGLEEAELVCDARQLERVLVNLLFNAIEAVGEGGRVTLGLGDKPRAGWVSMHVTDNGPGMGPELLPRVFDPFVTTKHTGTGLGLAIVHRIVEAHGGQITARNRPEGGAVFEVTLPAGGERSRADGADLRGG